MTRNQMTQTTKILMTETSKSAGLKMIFKDEITSALIVIKPI